MLRECIGMFGLLVLAVGGLCAEPLGTVYDLHLRYEKVEVIELVPGVEVPTDIWPDEHVVTALDLVSLGVSLDDAYAIVGESETKGVVVPCTWSQLKWCIENNIPMNQCCGEVKESG